MSFVSDFIQPIFPDGKYYFNPRGAGQFEPIERVPQFLRAEGNFASAICHFFTPIEPISHDGNCCVEAILIAHRGYIAYQKTDEGFFLLKKEIREFRDAVVRYAKEYEKELSTEFSQKDVSTLIQGYSTADQDLWTDDLALICASRCLQRPIIVYSRSGVVFSTDASGQLTPARMFSMEGVTRGAPIQLMFWDNAHYCLLNRREEP